jgi:limonene-1,2-epoxide hydrolase
MTHTFEATRRGLIAPVAIGGLLAAACASTSRPAEAGEMSALEKANVATVNDFLAALKPKDATAMAKYLTPASAYRMTETSPTDKGYDAIEQRLRPFVSSADRIEIKVLATHASGPIVINHRIDTFASSVRPLLFEGVGVFFLADGKIREWTDYTIRAALANEWPAEKR